MRARTRRGGEGQRWIDRSSECSRVVVVLYRTRERPEEERKGTAERGERTKGNGGCDDDNVSFDAREHVERDQRRTSTL